MDYTYRKGDICWYRDTTPCRNTYVKHGVRPAIIVSPDLMNFSSDTVIIVPMTSRTDKKCYPGQFDIISNGERGRVLCDQIRVVDKSRLDPPHTRIGKDVEARLNVALLEVTGFFDADAAKLA